MFEYSWGVRDLVEKKKSERENKGLASVYPYRKCYFYLDRKYSQKNDQILVANQPSRGVDCGDWVHDFLALFNKGHEFVYFVHYVHVKGWTWYCTCCIFSNYVIYKEAFGIKIFSFTNFYCIYLHIIFEIGKLQIIDFSTLFFK